MAASASAEVYGHIQNSSLVDRKAGVSTTGVLVTRPQEQQQPSSSASSDGAKGSFGDTFAVLVTLGFLSLALYVTFHYFWKKHRKRSIATLYKVDEYRYSRLSQSEMDGDNAVLYGDPNNPIDVPPSDDEDQGKPATLLVEPVPLISSSNSTSSKHSAGVQGTYYAATSQVERAKAASTSNNNTAALLLQDSDEDLLQ